MDYSSLILLVLAGLGIISGNSTVTIAMVVLLLLRVTSFHTAFPWLEKYGLTIGIIILTIGVMTPLASGKISINQVTESFLHWKSLLAIGIGILVAYLGGRGVTLMSGQPIIVTGLLIGTVIGVAFFKGVPVGPLIAAGLLSLLIGRS
ncbi:DUF441 domain-containing protein [Paenibacillus polymyxa]|jgi:uncharacterized membrane protein (DUF441 family)|uniref:UPF0756 membrane protein PPSC2_10355 n=2 Tax=Paenibacillus polymyxa TaxID=1406 RepID=E3EHL5_PAEPS|nr:MULTISPECIES: DUF441 domain-containing protein [Paenibacillus]MCV9950471.1 DUF441 domain-containing protein [Paenibacillus sp. BT-177]ADO56168.1 membrane protein [Paenibacillus polymyxa SC2]AHM65713.1 hypothetical protein PPSQR21_020650 [Paenibacillus polymyxa SQR-21]AIY11213.1 membrane protein [Paenibacillus polymyxa]AJE49891.1 membrane protein [Paenibacillus polymyxa]